MIGRNVGSDLQSLDLPVVNSRLYVDDLIILSAALFVWVPIVGLIALCFDQFVGVGVSNAMFDVLLAAMALLILQGLRLLWFLRGDGKARAEGDEQHQLRGWQRLGWLDLSVFALTLVLGAPLFLR